MDGSFTSGLTHAFNALVFVWDRVGPSAILGKRTLPLDDGGLPGTASFEGNKAKHGKTKDDNW
jgi:hypothetical protein